MTKHWLHHALMLTCLLGSGQSAIALPPFVTDSTLSHSIPLETVAMANTLELITWQLIRYRAADGLLVEAFGDRVATFNFQDGQVSGTTGCNRFFNAYTHEGDTLAIMAGGSTLMACFPDVLAEQEAAILTGLPQVVSYSHMGDELWLLDGMGDPLFTLIAQPTAELTHTEWTLTAYNNGRGGIVTLMADTAITATFNEKDGVVGSAGCNDYRAAYQVNQNMLTIGAPASTRRLCPQPDGIMQQETVFLSLLQDVATYTINGNQLELNNAEGTTLARFITDL